MDRLTDRPVMTSAVYRGRKISTEQSNQLTRPTLFYCADPAVFIVIQKKVKIFSCLPTLNCFRKIDTQFRLCQNCKADA